MSQREMRAVRERKIECQAAKSYRSETRALLRDRTAITCALAVSIVPLYGVFDYLLYPGQFFPLLAGRVLCSIGAAAIYLGLRRSTLGSEHPEWWTAAFAVLIATTMCGFQVYLVGFESPYHMSSVLAIMGMAVFFPLPLWEAAVIGLGLTVTYGSVAVLHGGIQNAALFAAHLASPLTATAIALVGVKAGERLRRAEFHARWALRKIAEEKTRLAQQMREEKAQLEALNQDMEDLLYVASHDLRAPLINVQGFARELQLGLAELSSHSSPIPEAKALREDMEESLRFILGAVARMDKLIDALLNISRVATGTKPTERVDLGPIVEKIVESFRYQLQTKGIEVRIGPLPQVVGDPVRLSQVFSNLIDNAIKYMGESPKRLIEVGAADDGTLYVRDSGPGIAKEYQEGIFRLFRRGNSSVPGEGIGLTVVRKIVEKHGGRIWVESELGAGTTFYFTLGSTDGAQVKREKNSEQREENRDDFAGRGR